MSDGSAVDAATFEAVLRGERATLTNRDVIVADGPDTVRFLHSQLSQDITSMVEGDVRWSFLLQPNGKLVGLLRVVRGAGDAVALDTDIGNGQAVLDALGRFKIRTKCELHLRADESFLATWATRMPAMVALAAGGVVAGEAVLDPLDAAVTDVAAIIRGFPQWGRELDDATIPNATGVVALAASFTKGCYTGQELVERIDSRGGNVPRRLVGIDFAELSTASSGDDLFVGGVVVAKITRLATDPRSQRSVALAYAKREVEDESSVVDAAGVAAEVRSLS